MHNLPYSAQGGGIWSSELHAGLAMRMLCCRDDVVEAARILNGTDMDGDGEGDFSMCWQLTDSDICQEQVFAAGQVCGRFCVDCMAAAMLLSPDVCGLVQMLLYLLHCPCVPTCAQVLASMTQSNGTMTHWLFNPDTLDAFVGSPAMAHALKIFANMAKYTPRDISCEVLAPANLAVRADGDTHCCY
eukprot:352483-Chlamydomonas_euryale.AAC.6